MRLDRAVGPALLAALVPACAAHPAPDAMSRRPAGEGPAAVEVAPGVVVSADRATAYLMVPGGGIEAVALAGGELVWRSAAADRPLGLAAGRLVAQIEPSVAAVALRLAILDPATGEAFRDPVEVPLPPGVPPRIEDTLGEQFRLAARTRGAELLVEWSFLERPVTGVSPAPGEPPAARRLAGAARVDPQAGTATFLEPAEHERDEAPAKVDQALGRASGSRPWRADELWLALEQTREAGGVLRLRLRRWAEQGADELPPIELFRGRAAGALPSADRRHVVVGTPAEAGSRSPWVWRFFSLADGEAAGSLSSELSLAPFLLASGGVLYLAPPAGRRVGERWVEEPLRLRMANLADGAERWTRPVRDVAFRGPRPPAG